MKTKDSIIAMPLSASTYLTRLRLVVPGTFFSAYSAGVPHKSEVIQK